MRHAGGAADQSEHGAFDQQLAHEAIPVRAESAPDGQLPPPGGALDEHQVRDVGARDEQQQADGGAKQVQRLTHVTNHRLLQRHHRRAALIVGLRVFLLRSNGDALEIGARLFERD